GPFLPVSGCRACPPSLTATRKAVPDTPLLRLLGVRCGPPRAPLCAHRRTRSQQAVFSVFSHSLLIGFSRRRPTVVPRVVVRRRRRPHAPSTRRTSLPGRHPKDTLCSSPIS